MFSPFASSARATVAGPPNWRTWTGLIALPVLVAALLTWAFAAPQDNHGAGRAAVVNNDDPVTIDGQVIPLGRELAGNLVHGDDSGYTWVLTDAADARDGLSSGGYAAVVTIPADFSARATSAAAGDPAGATQAVLDIRTSEAGGLADPAATTAVTRATVDTLNQQVVQTYLGNVYVGFSQLHDELGEAADGAGELADGAGQAATAAGQLSSGTTRLDGATGELADGAAGLADGATRVADGAGQLADGLTGAAGQAAQLPAATRQLADGAARVAAGNQQLAGQIVPIADRIITAIDALPSTADSVALLRRWAQQCPQAGGSAELCAALDDLVERFAADAARIDATKDKVRGAAQQARTDVRDLSAGAAQVADGSAELAGRATELSGGLAEAAGAARDLATGAHQLSTSAGQLAAGADQVHSGTSTLADGAARLAGGAEQVDAGARQVASGLAGGVDEVPDYTAAQRDRLARAAAAPATARHEGPDGFGPSTAVLFLIVALWVGAMATYFVIGAVPAGAFTSRRGTLRLALGASVPGLSLAVLVAGILTALLAPWLDLGAGRWFALLGVAVLAALSFATVSQAVIALLRRPGRIVLLAVLVLTLATAVVSTVPGFFGAVEPLLPTDGGLRALRAVATGTQGAGAGVAKLVVWLVLGVAGTVLATARQRTVSARQLRPFGAGR